MPKYGTMYTATDHVVGPARRSKHLCGVCNDCQQTLGEGTTLPQEPRGVHVYCFEPSLTHFEALLKLRKSLGSALKAQQAEWHLVNAAVGSGVRLVRFPRACDTELCAMAGSQKVWERLRACLQPRLITQEAGEPAYEAAMMVDIASFADAEGLQTINILKIDTEV